MLRQMETLKSYEVIGKDGELGKLDDFLIDDAEWTVRELVVRSGSWLAGRRVVILPHSVIGIDTEEKAVGVSLTRQQIEDAPVAPLDADNLLARHFESVLYDYYAFPYYWMGPYLWGYSILPNGVAEAEVGGGKAEEIKRLRESQIRHVRSFQVANGFSIRCRDGAMGDVEDMIFDDKSWSVSYLVVDTSKYLFGKNVLVPPEAIKEVNWLEATIYLDMTKAEVEARPKFKSIDDIPEPGRSGVVTVGGAR
jgi:sporulation protein YlmC with PRC-barrel domain